MLQHCVLDQHSPQVQRSVWQGNEACDTRTTAAANSDGKAHAKLGSSIQQCRCNAGAKANHGQAHKPVWYTPTSIESYVPLAANILLLASQHVVSRCDTWNNPAEPLHRTELPPPYLCFEHSHISRRSAVSRHLDRLPENIDREDQTHYISVASRTDRASLAF
jgi:hypothetical protein